MEKFTISQTNIMSNKDRKEFINYHLKKSYQIDEIEKHFFNSKWSISKLSGSKKRIVFFESDPIFYEYDKDIYYPTIYALNIIPNLIKNVCYIHPETDSFLNNGADLMCNGIINYQEIKSSKFMLGSLFRVTTSKGFTTSIGTSLVSINTIETTKGKFLKIVHRLNDELFNLGSKIINNKQSDNEIVDLINKINQLKLQNLKEIKNEIINNNLESNDITINNLNQNIDQNIDQTIDQTIDQNLNQNNDQNLNQYLLNKIGINIDNNDNIDEFLDVLNENENSIENTCKNNLDQQIISNNQKDNDNDNENNLNRNTDQNEINEDLIDEPEEIINDNILKVFYTIIKFSSRLNEELPIDPGKFLQNFMKPVANDFKIVLGFKKSMWKSINNFLKFLHKDHKSIVLNKICGNDRIMSVNKNNEHSNKYILINNFKGILSCDKVKKKEDEKSNILLDKKEKIEVERLFRPINMFVSLFSKMNPEFKKGDMFKISDINRYVIDYLKNNGLIDKDSITINQELSECLRIKEKSKINTTDDGAKQTNNKIETFKPFIITINDLLSYVKENLTEKDSVVKVNIETNEKQIISNKSAIKVVVTAKSVNNKNATFIDGLESMFILKDICSVFAKHFACSVCVKTISHKDVIQIQGYWVKEIVELLEKEFKIHKNMITIDDRLNLKKKK